jgi:hypothetical protein
MGGSYYWVDGGQFQFDPFTGKGSGTGHITIDSTNSQGCKYHVSADYSFTIGVNMYGQNVTMDLVPATASSPDPNPQALMMDLVMDCNPSEANWGPQGTPNPGASTISVVNVKLAHGSSWDVTNTDPNTGETAHEWGSIT